MKFIHLFRCAAILRPPEQTLRIMKLTMILLIAFLLQLSAASFAQRLTINNNNIHLQRAFSEIRKQTGYIVLYESELLKNTKPISLKLTATPLEEALAIILHGQNLQFNIKDKSIVIKAKQMSSAGQKTNGQSPATDVKGRILDENGRGLPGATVRIKGSTISVKTDENGWFTINQVPFGANLEILYIGYQTKEVKAAADIGNISLSLSIGELSEVSIINTGYQKLSRETSTGSHVQIDNPLIERSVSTNILTRLQDIVPGMIFNRNRSLSNLRGEANISIRGQSTIFANTQPLIILDNFPYEGDLANINPNDIESITVLKDAASASIWGARSGNGVIVLTSKRAKAGQPLTVNVSANLTHSPPQDLKQNQGMSSADFIETEKLLFAKGYYNALENSVLRAPLTPVVELLIAKRDGLISPDQADAKIEGFKNYDNRDQYMRYMASPLLNQQYAVNLSGTDNRNSYFVSAGYDYNKLADKFNSTDRFTLNMNDRLNIFSDKIELGVGLLLTKSIAKRPNTGFGALAMSTIEKIYPYAQLADQDGNPLPVVKDLRQGFAADALKNGFLDWQYKPLEELHLTDNTTDALDYRLNLNARYSIVKGLRVESAFQYGKSISQQKLNQSSASYFTRNLINRFTQLNPGGTTIYPVPLGGILDQFNLDTESFNFRAQANYQAKIADFELNALAGYDWRDISGEGQSNRYFGYNDATAQSSLVNYQQLYPLSYFTPSTMNIPSIDGISGTTDRYLSYYSNMSLNYQRKYVISASARIDRSNLFGVNSNQKGIPLWSLGLLWNLAKEDFLTHSKFQLFSFKASLGYNGNIDKSVSAYTTASYLNGSSTPNRQNYAAIINPPNPELRWERVKVINMGIDFGLKNNRISGSLEYYLKFGKDLIGEIPYAPSSGVTTFRGNVANTRVNGFDLSINTLNTTGQLKWSSNFWLSYANEIVTGYAQGIDHTASGYTQRGDGGSVPRKGYPLYSMYSFKWAGLSTTGEPQGFLNGLPSTSYQAIFADPTGDNLIFHGSAKPTFFGSFINTVTYRDFNLSANIVYRLGYYFRRNSIRYATVLTATGGHKDFAQRWQKPGDETRTDIPSLPNVSNANRDDMYLYSEVLVHRGDHIRLQDIRLGYKLPGQDSSKRNIGQLEFFGYLSNLGVIWKANKQDLDPDYATSLPPARSFALGIKFNF